MKVFPTMRTWLLCTACIGGLAISGAVAAQTADLPKDDPIDAEAAANLLNAQIEALQQQINVLKDKANKTEKSVSFKGAPEFVGDGWKFKVRGRLMYDMGYTSNPNPLVASRDFRFNSRIRRFRIGVEGELGGGFAYSAETDFANAAVGFGDVVLKWTPNNGPTTITIGNHETLNSVEQLTSSRFISFNERNQTNEAFYSGRRLGVSVAYTVPDKFLFSAGLFNDAIQATLGNDDWLFAARAVGLYKLGDTQVHLGAVYQHRQFQTNTQQNVYQTRPLTQQVGTRFVSTSGAAAFINPSTLGNANAALIGAGNAGIAASGDDTIGLELIAINGPLHFAAEAQYLKVSALPLSKVFGLNEGSTGARLATSPTFMGGYAEIGYYLTGETRGYKGFKWDRTKVLNPVSKGGMGAFQINGRVDFLDLRDTVGTGATTVIVNGGRQLAYQVGAIWLPIDYVRFYINYSRIEVKGGPLATLYRPTSTLSPNQRAYGSDVLQTRVAFDF